MSETKQFNINITINQDFHHIDIAGNTLKITCAIAECLSTDENLRNLFKASLALSERHDGVKPYPTQPCQIKSK